MVKAGRGEMLGAEFVHRRPELFKVDKPDKEEFVKPEEETVGQPPESVDEEDIVKKGIRKARDKDE